MWWALEQIPGLTALPSVWKKLTGDQFEAFRTLCLDPGPIPALSYPCPLESSCSLAIRNHSAQSSSSSFSSSSSSSTLFGVCRSRPERCPRVELELADITPLDLNWPKLGRAICRALNLASKAAPLAVPNTLQIGSWSADAVPVFLTIQTERHHLHYVICELIARLRQKFIVLTPTSKHFDAKSQELLAAAQSSIFALDKIVTLNPDGTLAQSSSSSLSSSSSTALSSSSSPSPTLDFRRETLDSRRRPRFALRKGLGYWTLVYDGHDAILKHERGLFYVSWLLTHPDETPIHALDLMTKIPEIYRNQLALTQIVDPETGKISTLESHARLQERSLSLDDAQAMRALFRKEKELHAILDDPDESEPVKAEALRDLEAIAQFQKQHAQRTRSGADRAARNVRQSIARFHQRLTQASEPGTLLRRFAEHLRKHILIPSARYSGNGPANARSGIAGCFKYEPTPGVVWMS